MINIRYPNLEGKTEEERHRKLESWLRYLVDQLNYALSMMEGRNRNG